MLRWLFNISAAVSLLLCVASVVMWMTSGTLTEGFARSSGSGEVAVWSYDGALLVEWSDVRSLPSGWKYQSDDGFVYYEFFTALDVAPDESFALAGFAYENYNSFSTGFGGSPSVTILKIPYWLIVVMAGALPAMRATQYWIRKRRRSQLHLCPACGYDLRGSAGKCPECGAARRRITAPH